MGAKASVPKSVVFLAMNGSNFNYIESELKKNHLAVNACDKVNLHSLPRRIIY